ncbi:MAG: hypothetical protein R2794_12500 [Chitinophagales bacterium]
MKRSSVLLFLFFSFSILHAQLTTFSADHDAFLKELSDFMKANNNEIGKQSYERFAKEAEAGNIAYEQIDQIINLGNKMLERRMKPTPQFVAVLDATVSFVKSGQLPERYDEWMTITNTILDNSRKGSYSTYNRFLDFSADFFGLYALNHTTTKTWSYTSFEYSFSYTDDVPQIHFSSTDLFAYTKGDTMFIRGTQGVYFPLEKEWKGTGGTINWSRAGLDSTTVYATVTDYTINTESNDYTAENAQLYFGGMFNKPLKGQLYDKLLTNNEPSKSDYPQFRTYEKTLTVKDILTNVDYKGGFFLKGSQIIGSGDDSTLAVMSFKDPHGKPAVEARSQTFLIEPGYSIYSRDAEAVINIGKEDSIYHHDVSLRYDGVLGTMNLTRQDEGFSSLMFYSSYHKVDAKVDNINWALGDTLIKMKNITGAGNKLSWFESQDLFSEKLFERVRGVSSYQPLVKIRRYCDLYNTREIPTLALARELNPTLTVDGVQSLLLQLVQEGFVYYDKDHEMVYVKDKTFNYVYASTGRKDYDIIAIPSMTSGSNATLNLTNYDLNINGISSFYLSDSQFVLIYPKDDKIILKKNRDMLFDGTIVSGNIDFRGKNFYFSYDTFNIKMNNVDSMILYVESVDVDDYGNPLYLPVNTNITVRSGRLQIDKTDNKSSKVHYPEYSIFTTYDFSIADYQKKEIFNDVYKKDDFYFKLDPFTIESSDSLDYRKVKFDGTMVSAGIFPDFRESLMLQEDRSLGFKSITPAGGYPTYGTLGNYQGKIFLSNKGFKGEGEIRFMASTSQAKEIYFFPDSTLANVDQFTVAKTENGVQFPQSSNTGVKSTWLPYADKMIVQQGATPFDMFDGASTLQGTSTVTSKGLLGSGLQQWGEVNLRSNQFHYKAENALADTAAVSIGQITADLVALKLDNVNANVDFKERVGHFKANIDTIMTELPYNQYKTDMNVFDWIMDERTVYFKSTKEFSNFYSTNGDQDSLVFQAKEGRFNLNTLLLNAEGVPLIRIADVFVIPDSGKVYVEKGAKMGTLYYAKIKGDTVNFYHFLDTCIVNIYGKNKMSGTGKYAYTTPQNRKETIPFEEISVHTVLDSIMNVNTHHMFAKGYVPDSSHFVLEDKVNFKGPVELYSNDKFLRFKGYVRLDVNDTTLRTDWFRVNSSIDNKNPVFSLNDAVNEHSDSVYAGVFRYNDTAALYTTIMGTAHSRTDALLFNARGNGYYNETDQTYYFGNLDKLDDPTAMGSIMKYNDRTGALYAEGRLNMGLKTDLCQTKAYGTIIKRPNNDQYKMDASITFEIPLPDDLMKKLSDMLYTSLSDAGAAPVDYNVETLLIAAFQQLADKKSATKLTNDASTRGYVERPKDYPVTIFLSGIKMVWDPGTRSFHTTGSDGKLLWFGDQQMNMQLKCYAEFGKRSGGDYFTLYLLTPSEDFIYINYKRNQLKLFTSREDLNAEIFSYNGKQRVIETDKGSMVFMLEGKNAVNQFVLDMQYYEGLKENK